MTDKELKRMSRAALLELLIEQMEENEKLKAELQQAQAQLSSREIQISEAGSIAEAALKLNGVFVAAENAAKQYVENVRALSSDQKELCRRMEQQAKQEAQRIILEAQTYSQSLKARADDYWKTVVGSAKQLQK